MCKQIVVKSRIIYEL